MRAFLAPKRRNDKPHYRPNTSLEGVKIGTVPDFSPSVSGTEFSRRLYPIGHGRDKEQIAIMSMSREHRHRAEDCLRLANETNELFAKMALLEMAAEFRARAQQLELRERRSRQRSAAIKKFSA